MTKFNDKNPNVLPYLGHFQMCIVVLVVKRRVWKHKIAARSSNLLNIL